VLQADEKATIRKMGEVFPLLVDPLQAAGAVRAQTQPCLEEELDQQVLVTPTPSLSVYHRWVSCSHPAQIYHCLTPHPGQH